MKILISYFDQKDSLNDNDVPQDEYLRYNLARDWPKAKCKANNGWEIDDLGFDIGIISEHHDIRRSNFKCTGREW